MFKVGDIVECIESRDSRSLLVGQMYIIISSYLSGNENFIALSGSAHVTDHYHASRFRLCAQEEIKTTAGTKYDDDKPRMDLVPYDAVVEIAKVLSFGAKKYGDGNWAKGLEISRLLGACERHLGEFKEGRDVDSETTLTHVAHAACNLLFILWTLKHRPELDNRWIKQVSASNNKQGE